MTQPRQPSDMVLGLYVLQYFVLSLSTMSTFVSKVCVLLTKGKTVHSSNGRFGTNPGIRSSPLIPLPRGGAVSICTVCGETNGRRPRAAWVDCSSNHTPLEWSWALTLERQISKVRPTSRGRDWTAHPSKGLS